MRRKWNWLFVSAMILVLVAGCGQLNIAAEGMKKLTPKEVLIKAEHAAEKSKGLSYKITGNQALSIEAGGQTKSVDQTIEGNIDLTNQPQAMHITMTVHSEGQKVDGEMYMVGNELYQKTVDGSGWLKSNAPDLGSTESQNPNEALQKLEELLGKLQTPEEKKMLKMTETANAYVLEINVDEHTPHTIIDKCMEEVKAAMLPQFQHAGIPVDADQIKLHQYSQKITIDKKSFRQTKVVQETKIEIPINDPSVSGTLNADQKMEMSLVGDFNETIKIPEDVKNSAQEVQVQ
ncbi:DUF6612 family protein [Polycladomyces subterraneus]|uniref:Lipoprotein n=1 Tax=Polycladomyces subterraneus TaxID=1016997 RepID=A0ABT8IKJ6_9BACL|nr:DUF6612 family protein [Polycladomyces subterraneus]MDN4592679.1 hypothetical protein [Polycladomyces subterraneus]